VPSGGCFKHCSEPLGSLKVGQFLDQPRDYQLITVILYISFIFFSFALAFHVLVKDTNIILFARFILCTCWNIPLYGRNALCNVYSSSRCYTKICKITHVC
jgi:hypothetical protein